jgi:RNA-binding protein 39
MQRRQLMEAQKLIEQASKCCWLIGAEKQKEEQEREDSTVLVNRLHLKANEQDVYKFFKEADCGKIRDIRIIRDSRSKKSKG